MFTLLPALIIGILILEIFTEVAFLKISGERAFHFEVGWSEAFTQWLYLLFLKVLTTVPLVIMGLYTPAIVMFVLTTIFEIFLLKITAEAVFRRKIHIEDALTQWGWLLLLRLITITALFIVTTFIILIMG